MNLGREASALVVRFRTTATNTNMRELALLGSEIADLALKPKANFFLVVRFVEILLKIDRELHEILEVLRSRRRRRAFPLPFPALTLSSFRPLRAKSRSRKRKHRRTSTKRGLFLPLLRGDLEAIIRVEHKIIVSYFGERYFGVCVLSILQILRRRSKHEEDSEKTWTSASCKSDKSLSIGLVVFPHTFLSCLM